MLKKIRVGWIINLKKKKCGTEYIFIKENLFVRKTTFFMPWGLTTNITLVNIETNVNVFKIFLQKKTYKLMYATLSDSLNERYKRPRASFFKDILI